MRVASGLARVTALFGCVAFSPVARAQEAAAQALTADEAARRARASSVTARSVDARVGLARALRVGADLFVRENPTLSLWAGPRLLPTGTVLADVTVALSFPFDVSGSRGQRSAWGDAMLQLAEVEADEARRNAALDAREAHLDATLARMQLALYRARLELDETALRIAEVRRAQGAAGDDEVALARVLIAQSRARVEAQRGLERAALERLRVRLQLDAAPEVRGELEPDEAPAPLESLLARLARRPEVRRADAAVEAARRDATLQERLGVPLPRAGLGLGRENEYYARLGLDVALPVFQRNQTAVAQARAQAQWAQAERGRLLAAAESEFRSAYATLEGARASYAVLASALEHAREAERLSLRGYELGQRSLAETLVTLRETAALRQSHYEALASVARARLALERAIGELS